MVRPPHDKRLLLAGAHARKEVVGLCAWRDRATFDSRAACERVAGS